MELQEKAFLEGAKSYRASRTWPVEKGMPRVHSWRVLCWGRWCAKFQPAWSDPLRKHSLVRQTWVALAVVSFVSVLRAGELLEKIRQILGLVTVTFFFLLTLRLILSYDRFRSYLSAVTSLLFFHRYDSSMISFDSSSPNLVIL